MGKQQLLKLLTHPFFIGLIITAAIVISVSPNIQKYKVDVIEKRIVKGAHTIYVSDLDNDQSSEVIEVDIASHLLKIMCIKGKGVIEQFNLRSKPLHTGYIYFEDYNNDGLQEIFLLSHRNDSLFLSIIDPINRKEFIILERLVFHNDSVSYNEETPQGNFMGLTESGLSSEKDIVFSIVTGYSKQPRNFFRYNIRHDQLTVSPKSGVSIFNSRLEDLDGDSIPEILFSTSAVGNYDTYIPYSDHSTWLMILNTDLEFLFEPVEFPGYPSYLKVSSLHTEGTNYIAALHDYFGADTIQPALYLHDLNGNKLLSKSLEKSERYNYHLTNGQWKGKSAIYVLEGRKGFIRVFDDKLEEIGKFSIPKLHLTYLTLTIDIDADGVNENICRGEKAGTFVVFRENFRHPLIVDLRENVNPQFFSTYFADGIPYLYIHYSNNSYILDYGLNPLYYLKFPLLLLTYALISFLILLVFRLQKYRAEKSYQTKKKISELQILNLKNQIDPHFTFNVLNSIGSLYTREANKDLAYNIFVKYSNLLRFTIQNSDNISIPIKDELDFVNTYVELEQFRSGNTFNYNVIIEDGIDLEKTIPRMLIHSFVENSIKHGAKLAEKDPLLELKISRNKTSTLILIQDNGPGLNSKTDKQVHSTGRGLHIIDEMLSLFYQLEGVRITYTLEDISAKDPNWNGTIACITIPV